MSYPSRRISGQTYRNGKEVRIPEDAEELRKSILREFDYRQEATNLRILGENLKDFEKLIVPGPVDDFTTTKVLTMDYIRGKKITTLTPLARDTAS